MSEPTKPTTNKPPTPEEVALLRREPPLVMNVHEVSVFLNQSERKTREDISLRRIPSIRLGGRILVRRCDLEQALAALVRR